MSTESVMLSHPLQLLILPSVFLSTSVFSNELPLCIPWPKNWSLSFSISLPNEYSGLTSFYYWLLSSLQSKRLKSLLQHHNLKASMLWHAAFFSSNIHTWLLEKTIDLNRGTFVGKVMSLPFNMLSRFVKAFIPRSKCLLISWLQSLSAVILDPGEIKFVTASTFPLLSGMKWWDQMPWS